MIIDRCIAPKLVALDEHDEVLAYINLPISDHLLGALAKAYDMLADGRGLQTPVLLLDGSNRVVARRIGAPERGTV